VGAGARAGAGPFGARPVDVEYVAGIVTGAGTGSTITTRLTIRRMIIF
jgi:hypothetical protein